MSNSNHQPSSRQLQLVPLSTRAGLRVSRLCLGTANLGQGVRGQRDPDRFLWGRRGDGASPAESRKIFEEYVDAGGNFFDSASSYQFGESERVLGEFTKDRRDHFVIATKFSADSSAESRTEFVGNSRKALRLSVEGSLRRLNTEYIDMLWVHFPDGLTPLKEIVSSLGDLVHAGKILYYGLSNFPAWQVATATQFADSHGVPAPTAIQIGYNMLDRSAEADAVAMAQSLNLGLCAWGPLAGGLLSGSYHQENAGTWRKADNPRAIVPADPARAADVLDRLMHVAIIREESPATIAIAWILSKYGGSTGGVIPIIGPRSTSQLTGYLRAADITLSASETDILDGDPNQGSPVSELARIVLDS